MSFMRHCEATPKQYELSFPRHCEALFLMRHCEATPKQSSLFVIHPLLDCFVASLRAMTGKAFLFGIARHYSSCVIARLLPKQSGLSLLVIARLLPKQSSLSFIRPLPDCFVASLRAMTEMVFVPRHCEAFAEAIQPVFSFFTGLLCRFAPRNDGKYHAYYGKYYTGVSHSSLQGTYDVVHSALRRL